MAVSTIPRNAKVTVSSRTFTNDNLWGYGYTETADNKQSFYLKFPLNFEAKPDNTAGTINITGLTGLLFGYDGLIYAGSASWDVTSYISSVYCYRQQGLLSVRVDVPTSVTITNYHALTPVVASMKLTGTYSPDQ